MIKVCKIFKYANLKIESCLTHSPEAIMVLSNKSILEEMEKGNIVISPFVSGLLGPISYDVTLGSKYYRQREIGISDIHVPYNKEHVQKRWGQPEEAKTLAVVCKELGLDPKLIGDDISMDAQVIIFGPGENILAHTLEFIGPRGNIMATVHNLSGMRRNQFTICDDADVINPGYINRLTLEIENLSKKQHSVLVVGQPIAQYIFTRTEELLPDTSYELKGSYQQGSNLEEIKNNWNPGMMLPKMKIKVLK